MIDEILVKISFKAVKDFLTNDIRNVDFPSSELMIKERATNIRDISDTRVQFKLNQVIDDTDRLGVIGYLCKVG